MQREPEIICLGDKSWKVRPLTLRQVRDIEPLTLQATPGQSIGMAIKVISIALQRDHEKDAGDVENLEAYPEEILKAMNAVFRLGGFIPAEAAPLGESEAAPSIGASSEAA